MDKLELRIGILGGTFDPPHIAHLRIAEEVRINFALDEVWFIPASHPPHKKKLVASFKDRYNMIFLSTNKNPYFKVLDIEKEEKPSYTLKTLQKLKTLYPGYKFYLIIGWDAFEEFETWWHYEKFLDHTDIIVVSRGYKNWKNAYKKLHEKAKKLWKKVENLEKRICFLEVFPLEISSTKLKELMKKKQSIRYLVTEEVYLYIEERGLYKEDEGKY